MEADKPNPSIPKGVLNSDYQTVLTIHNQIINNLSQPLPTVAQLAKQANMSASKFRALFKKIYQQPIYQYHLLARLKLAKLMLIQNNYTITQIAYKVGFSHPSAFVHIFHKTTGMFPLAFRELALGHAPMPTTNLKHAKEIDYHMVTN